MVAPTRKPQARGVKCELCKVILNLTTWLDQTKLAKNTNEPMTVLNLFNDHDKSQCPCIPKNIQNLIVGSTHFELHRLVFAALDSQVHTRHSEQANQRIEQHAKEKTVQQINDCLDSGRSSSRFKLVQSNKETTRKIRLHLSHLTESIKFWNIAMEDQTSPFNSQLALRLGLTHHVIYACYLFKFYKILDQQLITANLLLNIFHSIDGVSAHAIVHAKYLLIRSLLDVNKLHLAKHQLKVALKNPCYQDTSHYECILLKAISAEINLLTDCDNTEEIFDELIQLSIIQPNDKLQYYYARTLALATVLKYIHLYPSKSNCCLEFYHVSRFACAMIRRCFDSSFELVLREKISKMSNQEQSKSYGDQFIGHSWMKMAICDFVFNSFQPIQRFFSRAGLPESLDLLFNSLNLISHRTGCVYWQYKVIEIGFHLDLLCDKTNNMSEKLEALEQMTEQIEDPHLMNLIKVSMEICALTVKDNQKKRQHHSRILILLGSIKVRLESLEKELHPIRLYDSSAASYSETSPDLSFCDDLFPLNHPDYGLLSLEVIRIAVSMMQSNSSTREALETVMNLGIQLSMEKPKILTFDQHQLVLDILVTSVGVDQSEATLLNAISDSEFFLKQDKCFVSRLADLSISSDNKKTRGIPKASRTIKKNVTKTRRKAEYNVVNSFRENLPSHLLDSDGFPPLASVLASLSSYTTDRVMLTYLKNADPNPNYLTYRRAHEILLSHCLRDEKVCLDQLLFHFSESCCSNSMRYRWMMLKEAHLAAFDHSIGKRGDEDNTCMNFIGFHFDAISSNIGETRTMRRSIPKEHRIVQIKYIKNESNSAENLLIASYDRSSDPIFTLVRRNITDIEPAIFEKFHSKLELARKTLFLKNQRTRSEKRQTIETEMSVLLDDIENEFFGPFRFLLCPKARDDEYNSFVESVMTEVALIFGAAKCKSQSGLELLISNAPLLARHEFCAAISALYDCDSESKLARDCFDRWVKSMEAFLDQRGVKVDKLTYLRRLARGHLGLILDQRLEHIPFESLPTARMIKHGMFRVPSLRLLYLIAINRQVAQSASQIDLNAAFYILDPANNLGRTRQKFEAALRAQDDWLGWIGRPPEADQLEELMTTRDFYLFIGHGAGTTYYNQLRNGRGLNAMSKVQSISIVMGCSSGRQSAEGPRLETFGINWLFVMLGSPCYVGLLWDVTDTDIDKFLDSLLISLLGKKWKPDADTDRVLSISAAIAEARQACQLKHLVGAAPVLFGLPVQCKH